MDGGEEPSLLCPICVEWYCEPITLPCAHSFCRLCLLQATHLSPDASCCPLCRQLISINNLRDHPLDESVESEVRRHVREEDYDSRRAEHAHRIAQLQQRADLQLPVFCMAPVTQVGQPVALQFFESRYKILIRRAWEGNRLFVHCSTRPAHGSPGTIVRVESAQFLADGCADISGVGMQAIQLGSVWQDVGTGGLWYTKLSEEVRPTTLSGSVNEAAEEQRQARGAPNRQRSVSCTIS